MNPIVQAALSVDQEVYPPDQKSDMYRYVNMSSGCIYCFGYMIERKTPQGYWLKSVSQWAPAPYVRKWIANRCCESRKFAFPTKKEAMKDFIRRKKIQLRIHEAICLKADDARLLAESALAKPELP